MRVSVVVICTSYINANKQSQKQKYKCKFDIDLVYVNLSYYMRESCRFSFFVYEYTQNLKNSNNEMFNI